MGRFLSTIAALLFLVLPANATESVDAVWHEQKIEFTFFGIDVAYSCDLVQARVAMLLRHLGAADDVHVTTTPCLGFDRPQKRHRITATFSTLVPAAEGQTDVVKATWTEVELGRWQPRSLDNSDCELLEQFQKSLLPTISHEVIDGRTGCDAARKSIAGRLRLKVLKPVVTEPTPKEDDHASHKQ